MAVVRPWSFSKRWIEPFFTVNAGFGWWFWLTVSFDGCDDRFNKRLDGVSFVGYRCANCGRIDHRRRAASPRLKRHQSAVKLIGESITGIVPLHGFFREWIQRCFPWFLVCWFAATNGLVGWPFPLLLFQPSTSRVPLIFKYSDQQSSRSILGCCHSTLAGFQI